MRLIPVIDIRGGEAVAASRGDRASYRPLHTPLVGSADPVAVAEALHALYPFPTLYVADLDGIEGRGADIAMQRRVADAWPGREVWIDDGGFPSPGADAPASPHRGEAKESAIPSPLPGGERSFPRHRAGGAGEGAGPLIESQPPYQPTKNRVLGSESIASLEDYLHARRRVGPDAPLSLDFRGDAFLGPPALLLNPDLWPRRVIVMTLARVGSGEGPDLARLASVVGRAGACEVFAAGGVRNADDLRALRDLGVAGALVSTALHQRAIVPADLDALGIERDLSS